MQKNLRISEGQLLYLANKGRVENSICGYLYKRSADMAKWQQRYFVLYQNVLFYFDNETSARPSGVALLEGAYCDRIIAPVAIKGRETEKQYCFTITYKIEGQRQYDLRSESETECNAWIDAIKRASYSKVLEQKEELEQKHLHLLQILDSERQAKWHYVQQTEELACEVKKLKEELQKFKKEVYGNHAKVDEETDDLKKIKKVAVSVGLSFTISACLAASFIPSMLSSITHHGRQARTAHSTQRQVFIRTRDNKIYISQTVLNDFALDALNKVNQ